MSNLSLRKAYPEFAIVVLLLVALATTWLAGCAKSDQAATAQDPTAFDHKTLEKPMPPEVRAQMQAYMQSHRTVGPPTGPAAKPSIVK
jgi:hypothetical protein